MKQRTQEMLYIIGIMLALLFVGVNLMIDNIVPKKFYCDNNLIANQLEPVDYTTMFSDCMGKCSQNNIDCIKSCVRILDYGLEQGVVKIEIENKSFDIALKKQGFSKSQEEGK